MMSAMAIHMKEWGMLQAPSPGVRIPVPAGIGWDNAAHGLGSGISSLLAGSAALAAECEEVNSTGELAEFTGKLQKIGEETREELAEREVKDWDYSWKQAWSPRLAEAVAELSPEAREAGQLLAEAYSRSASVQALRDREVAQLQRARSGWNQQLEAAVQAGDAAAADAWLERGAGIFVPQEELDSQRSHVRSRACAAGWKAALAAAPLQALADYAEAAPEGLPQGEEAALLKSEVERSRKLARAGFAAQLTACVGAEKEPDAAEMQRAARAGVLTPAQLASAGAEKKPLSDGEWCVWLRRVDEAATGEEALPGLQLDIATAAIPLAERRVLLERLALAGQVDAADRCTLSRGLWQLYEAGQLGCPGDAAALERLGELQRRGLPVLAREGTDAAARWLEQVRAGGARWVCFGEKEK